jgi:hypothetical protein
VNQIMKRFLILGALALAAATHAAAGTNAKIGLGLKCELERTGQQQMSYPQPGYGGYAAPGSTALCPPTVAPAVAPPLAAPRYPQGGSFGLAPQLRFGPAISNQTYWRPYPAYYGYPR